MLRHRLGHTDFDYEIEQTQENTCCFLIVCIDFDLNLYNPAGCPGYLGHRAAPPLLYLYGQPGPGGRRQCTVAGDYTVSFTLSGMQSFAVMQYTMSYDAAVLTVNGHSDLLSDSLPDQLRGLGAAGVLVQNGTINFGFITRVDQTATTTAIDAAGQLLLKLQVTVTTEAPVDFAKIVTLDTDPNQTFIEADYADYADYGTADQDCYALVTAFDGYAATLYPMTADLSPATGHAVTGKVLALANTSGKVAGSAFTVIGCDVLINGEVVATTGADGVFTIPSLAAGTYTATLSYAYGYDRDIKITVADTDVDLGTYGMVVCNFKKDATVDASDFSAYKRATGKSSSDDAYNAACDFNHDGNIDATDYSIYKAFTGKNLNNDIYANA